MNRSPARLAALLVLAACTGEATDKIGGLDTSPVGCDRIHGATGIVLMEDGGNTSHFPTAAPDETTVTSSVAGPTGDGAWLSVAGARVMVSEDEGCNWENTGGSLPGTGEWDLVVAGGTAWAFDRRSDAMATSTDGGISWSAASTLGTLLAPAAVDPANPARLRGVTAAGVVGSDDGGASWTPLGSPPPSPGLAGAVYPAAPDTAVVVTANGLAVTRTSGESWVETGASLLEDGISAHRIAFATDNADTLWIAGEQEGFSVIFRSANGGEDFSDVASSRSLDLDVDAPLWPVPGAPNELVSAWGSSEDNYGINVYYVIAGDSLHTTKVGAYYHVNDVGFTESGSWLLGVDGVK